MTTELIVLNLLIMWKQIVAFSYYDILTLIGILQCINRRNNVHFLRTFSVATFLD